MKDKIMGIVIVMLIIAIGFLWVKNSKEKSAADSPFSINLSFAKDFVPAVTAQGDTILQATAFDSYRYNLDKIEKMTTNELARLTFVMTWFLAQDRNRPNFYADSVMQTLLPKER